MTKVWITQNATQERKGKQNNGSETSDKMNIKHI